MRRNMGRSSVITAAIIGIGFGVLGAHGTVGACGEDVEDSPVFDPPGAWDEGPRPRDSNPPAAIDESTIEVEMWRNKGDEGDGGCEVAKRCASPSASFRVSFAPPADDETPTDELGYRLEVVGGESPLEPVNDDPNVGWFYAPNDEISFSIWIGTEGFDFTLTPVDGEGNLGPTTSVLSASL